MEACWTRFQLASCKMGLASDISHSGLTDGKPQQERSYYTTLRTYQRAQDFSPFTPERSLDASQSKFKRHVHIRLCFALLSSKTGSEPKKSLNTLRYSIQPIKNQRSPHIEKHQRILSGRDYACKFMALPIWGSFEGVILFLAHKLDYHNADLRYIFQRICLFVLHPQRFLYESKCSAATLLHDKIYMVASENYRYACQRILFSPKGVAQTSA